MIFNVVHSSSTLRFHRKLSVFQNLAENRKCENPFVKKTRFPIARGPVQRETLSTVETQIQAKMCRNFLSCTLIKGVIKKNFNIRPLLRKFFFGFLSFPKKTFSHCHGALFRDHYHPGNSNPSKNVSEFS